MYKRIIPLIIVCFLAAGLFSVSCSEECDPEVLYDLLLQAEGAVIDDPSEENCNKYRDLAREYSGCSDVDEITEEQINLALMNYGCN